ncbi:hypothetical protein [Candidatus Chloroploca asiatica]|uniref:Alpha/beta hydrolase n=1 Tax=Candidatus Chloroploca asiatica TaxID=1506545 RepID=A0A2H3KWA8_9CHLR|nr:hypothetical protein [Candidatus Chloroploca asiatica]PDV99669.1 hypothetical protein A9Q02_00135 [Candidatus Chloroploca asiatica]
MTLFVYTLQLMINFIQIFGLELLFLVSLMIFVVLLAGLMVPLSILGWWAGGAESARIREEHLAPQPKPARPSVHARPQPSDTATKPEHFLVYLSGIGDVSGEYLGDLEWDFVNRLKEALPHTHVIHNIFAFSVNNVGLTEESRFGRFWDSIQQARAGSTRMRSLGGLINFRNLLHVAVSADQRYGPVFNYGTASTIMQSLLEAGYQPGDGRPVTLYGYSGGGQVVLGSAQYLKPAIQAPLQVISMGGVMSDSYSIALADQIIHLEGDLDSVQRLGDYLFPRRWPIARNSRWNKAVASGKLRRFSTGPMTHSGSASYFDDQSFLPDGQSYLDYTIELATTLIEEFRVGSRSPSVEQ